MLGMEEYVTNKGLFFFLLEMEFAKLMKRLYSSWTGLICIVWDVCCLETFTGKGCLLKDEFTTGIEVAVVVKQIKKSQTNCLHFESFKKQLRSFEFTCMFSVLNQYIRKQTDFIKIDHEKVT